MAKPATSEERNKYVLIADADPGDRFSISMLLQRFGYTIVTTGTAEEAIDFLHVALPSAIIADAGLTGAPLLTTIKKDRRFSSVPLILIASSNTALEDHWTREGQIAASIRKPINVEELYRVVQAVVEHGPRRNIRIPIRLAAMLEDDTEQREGFVTTLSGEGMFFQGLEPRPVHTRIPMSFELNGRTIAFEAVVLYSGPPVQRPFGNPGMGMKFETMSPVDRDLIKTFILDQIKEGITRHGYYNC